MEPAEQGQRTHWQQQQPLPRPAQQQQQHQQKQQSWLSKWAGEKYAQKLGTKERREKPGSNLGTVFTKLS